MIKNTKANLTLIFCINKKNAKLAEALDAISRQTDKNFDIIFVFNGAYLADKELFNTYNFKSVKNVRNVILSENMGDVYAFKCCEKFINTKYLYYFDSNVILHPDFVATINTFISEHPESDVISFFGVPNIYFKEPYLKVKTLSDDFCYRPLVSFDNKIIRLNYLSENKIEEPLFKSWSTYFYVLLLKGNPKWYSIGRRLCDVTQKQVYQYNVMDLYDQCEALVELLDEKPFRDHVDEIEYICMVTLFRNFLYAFVITNKGRPFLQRKILNKIEEFMNKNFPRWQQNKFLDSKINKNDPTYINFIKDFRPKLSYVYKTIISKEFLKGYGRK